MVNYPLEIIPKANYKFIDSDLLNRIDGIYLVRRSLKNIVEKDRFDHIKLDSLLEEGKEGFFYNLSWNLLGVFKSIYVVFNVKCGEWQSGQDGFLPEDIEHLEGFSVCDNPPLFLKLNEIHGFPFTYQKKKNEDATFTKVLVEHKPTMANFWHFQFAVYEKHDNGWDAKPINPAHKGWRYNSLENNTDLKIMLANNIKTEEPMDAVLCPKELYM